jgi:hypothetical protein
VAVAATDNGPLAPELSAGSARTKSAKSNRRRRYVRQVATVRQPQALLNAPDIATTTGLRAVCCAPMSR